MPWWGWVLVGVGVWVLLMVGVLVWFRAVAIGDQERDEEAELEARLWSIARHRELDRLTAEHPGL